MIGSESGQSGKHFIMAIQCHQLHTLKAATSSDAPQCLGNDGVWDIPVI